MIRKIFHGKTLLLFDFLRWYWQSLSKHKSNRPSCFYCNHPGCYPPLFWCPREIFNYTSLTTLRFSWKLQNGWTKMYSSAHIINQVNEKILLKLNYFNETIIFVVSMEFACCFVFTYRKYKFDFFTEKLIFHNFFCYSKGTQTSIQQMKRRTKYSNRLLALLLFFSVALDGKWKLH